MSARFIHIFFCFSLLLMNKNVKLKRVCQRCNGNCEKEKECLKTTYYKKKIRVLESVPINAGRNLRGRSFYAGHVVLLADGLPKLIMSAPAILVVGTSGIPPKLNYRSVKSYNP